MEAPRWRLINAHYLRVPQLPDGTVIEHEHKETARESGRTIRKLFPVPMLLDPKDAADCNYPGEIIVAHEVEGARNERADYLFLGEPTPEMEPLNDAAEAISNSLRSKWEHPIDTLPVNGGMNSEESAFMAKMMEAFGKGTAQNQSVPQAEYDALKERLAALEAAIAQQKPPAEAATRRV